MSYSLRRVPVGYLKIHNFDLQSMGGDLGGWGDGPPKFEVGTAHASDPQYFEK